MAVNSTFNKCCIFIVVSMSLLMAVVVVSDDMKEATLKTESYYYDNVKDLGTTLRECSEARADNKILNKIESANCKTANKVSMAIVSKSFYG